MASDRPEVGPALRRLLAEAAQADAPALVEEARAGARARVRVLVEDALVDELLGAIAAPRAAAEEPDRRPPSVPGRAPRPAAQPRDTTGHIWWAYCVLDAERAVEVAGGIPGVDPKAPVEPVIEGELAALVSRVPLSEFGDETLREHLEDIEWLERVARAHEAVLESALKGADIVPLRLCTLYRNLDGIRDALRTHEESLADSLAAVAGASEWGVKVFLHALRAVPAARTEAAGNASGVAYLAGRQRERQLAERVDELCTICSQEVHRTLTKIAREDRLNPVQRPEAHGRQAEMILNGAYLVDSDRLEELRSAVGQLDERWEPEGFAVELTGPWPPYNFIPDSAGMIP